jgi:spore maturation protein CgeB
MRILTINRDYPAFLKHLYASNPGLDVAPYEEQLRVRNESHFGVADYYSSNLRALGHDSWDLHANNSALQNAWAEEHGIRVSRPGVFDSVRSIASNSVLKHLKPMLRPLSRRFSGTPRQSMEVLAAQIRHYKPDVVLNQALDEIPDAFFQEMRKTIPLMVGQIASPLIEQSKFPSYDLVISSLPNFVNYFRNQGIAAELNRLAFQPSVLEKLRPTRNPYGATFVGSLSPYHKSRVDWIRSIATQIDLHIWGQGADAFPEASPIRKHHHGPAWGIEMFQILHDSRITLNHHIGIAEGFANNMRLFEATGSGTLLVTDHKANLHEIFELGKEVIAYRSPGECLEAIRYFTEHESARKAIALAGQARTIRDHSYRRRMEELVEILERHLRH